MQGGDFLMMFSGLGKSGGGGPVVPTQQALGYDEFSGAGTTSGVNPTTVPTTSGNAYVKHPSWAGNLAFTGAGRVRHASGTIAMYLMDIADVADCVVYGRFYFSDGWNAISGNQQGIIARASSVADTMYYAYFNVASQTFTLARRLAGAVATLGAFTPTSLWWTSRWAGRKGGYCDVAIVCVGTSIKLFIDGVQRVSVTDANIASGKPGIFAFTPVTDVQGIQLEALIVRTAAKPLLTTLGFTQASATSASQMTFGGVRAVRSDGATIFATVVPNLDGAGSTAPYTYSWYRSTDPKAPPSAGTLLTGQTTATLDDHTAPPNTTLYYRCGVVDSQGNTAYTDVHTVTTLAVTDRLGMFVGDSLTWGVGTGVTAEVNDYPTQCVGLLGAPWKAVNFGNPSWSDIDLSTWMPNFLPYQTDINLAKCVAVYWEGTNSLVAVNAATAYSRTVTSCQYLKSLGIPVVVCNVIDRQQAGVPGDMATRIADYNASLLAGWTGFADAHIDLHALLPDSTNTTYFQTDKVHLTVAGYGVVAAAVQAVLAAL